MHTGPFPCFSNPPNSDKDRVFNVCMWSLSCVRIHTGVGYTDSESAQCFWLGKTHKFSLCSSRGSSAVKFHTAYTLRRKHVKCCHALVLRHGLVLTFKCDVWCPSLWAQGKKGSIKYCSYVCIYIVSDARVCKMTYKYLICAPVNDLACSCSWGHS